MEMKKLKKLVIELERELERLQRGAGGSTRREKELEDRLGEREREIGELRRMRRGESEDDVLGEVEAHNAFLVDEIEGLKVLLEENNEEMERLREIVESKSDESQDASGRQKYKRRIQELEGDNEDLRAKLEEQAERIAQADDDKENLADEVEALRLDLEEMQRRRDAEAVERSQSRSQLLEEREEREAVEDDLNSLRDKLAAATIEMQQREDEVEMKNKEIEDLVAEHERIVEVVETEWRGEVEEARAQVEELRDVSAFGTQSFHLGH